MCRCKRCADNSTVLYQRRSTRHGQERRRGEEKEIGESSEEQRSGYSKSSPLGWHLASSRTEMRLAAPPPTDRLLIYTLTLH
ncbi:unnamed protein product [Pleuronectes platessa]|uniref:Uncharacterized protein n=1 Tax=Pleuronectes platessa TaxID=8262 RepID=A0A9N7VFI9_PLEPL|nr:unnamed protein product [Pleuronectes platessa]